MIFNGRTIVPGNVQGEALVTSQGISFFGGVDPETGQIVERGHELEGRSIAGKILVFPSGKGSTVGSYTLYQLKFKGLAPLAILNSLCETITAVGCIIAEIPCIDGIPIEQLHSGQSLAIDAAGGKVEILSPPAPIPDWLRGCETGSFEGGTFATDTLSRRLPGIVRRVNEENEWPHEIVARVQTLVDEMPDAQLRPLQDPGAPDAALWQDWIAPYVGQTWLETSWFAAEVYAFRRVLEATGYYQSGLGKGIDPFRRQKLYGLQAAPAGLLPMCYQLEAWYAAPPSGEDLHKALANLLRAAVWGNQADLSVFPAGGAQPDAHSLQEQQAHLLADDSQAAAAYIIAELSNRNTSPDAAKGASRRVDFILDNVGLELGYDLVLADYLLQLNLAGPIRFFAKPHPTYVSDATIADILETIAYLVASTEPALHHFGQRLDGYIHSGRLQLTSDYFWISPLPAWEMPPALRDDLSQSALIISKGDANYRRWLGDRHWPFSTPFAEIVSYSPAPLLALRVMKAELVVGLPAARQLELDAAYSHWMTEGQWAVIQFAR
jgi:predicted aconitase with swiveling domain/uncharacterized protein with ATP-grasp and redox domains